MKYLQTTLVFIICTFSNDVFAENMLKCQLKSYPPYKISDFYHVDIPRGSKEEIIGQHLINHINISANYAEHDAEYYVPPVYSPDHTYVILDEKHSYVSFGLVNMQKIVANYTPTEISWDYRPARAYYNLNRISGVLTERKFIPQWFITGWVHKYGGKYPSELKWEYMCTPAQQMF